MAEKMSGLSRDLIIHPGETLKEILEDRGMTQRELAMRTDVKEPHISGIVNCQKPISVSFAKKLEYALGVEASFWINLQANYEKELADYEEMNQVSPEELSMLQRLRELNQHTGNNTITSSDAQDHMLVIEWRKRLHVSNLAVVPQLYPGEKIMDALKRIEKSAG